MHVLAEVSVAAKPDVEECPVSPVGALERTHHTRLLAQLHVSLRAVVAEKNAVVEGGVGGIGLCYESYRGTRVQQSQQVSLAISWSIIVAMFSLLGSMFAIFFFPIITRYPSGYLFCNLCVCASR